MNICYNKMTRENRQTGTSSNEKTLVSAEFLFCFLDRSGAYRNSLRKALPFTVIISKGEKTF